MLNKSILAALLLAGSLQNVEASSARSNNDIIASTEAGKIDFQFMHQVRFPGVNHKISAFLNDAHVIELDDGSMWNVSKADLIRGWDRSNHLVLAQNQATFSTHRYALINSDLKLAVPVSLVREPTPREDNYYIKSVDRVNDLITLNNGKHWRVHSSDHGTLSKMTENDRVIVGANVAEVDSKSPYILINTHNNSFVRASLIEN